MDKTAINSNKQYQLWICRNAELPSLQYIYFLTLWLSMNKLTSSDIWVFSHSAVWLYRLPIQHRPGINTQSATGILNQEFMHWFYELKPLTRRQQALTGLQTSCLPLMYLSESPCTQHWAALPWSTFSTLSTLSAPRCTKSDLSAPRNI